MTFSRSALLRMRRATAWTLFWICLWMGTGVALNHTDAAPASGSGSHSVQHGLTATSPADLCAACQWTQGLNGRTVNVCQVSSLLLFLPPRLTAAISPALCRMMILRSPRAPPTTLPAA